MSRLGPLERAWLHLERPDNPMGITAVLLLESAPTWEGLREAVATRLVGRYPRLRDRIAHGWRGPRWEPDPSFSLDDHLDRRALPAPADPRALQQLVGALMGTPIPLDRAPWSMHLVDCADGTAALIARFHHTVGDGVALTRVLVDLTDGATAALVPFRRPPLRAWDPRLWVVAALSAIDLGFSLLLADGREGRLPIHQPLAGQKRCAWSEPIPLARVKAIGRARGATVNEVMLAAVGGALGRHLREVGAPIDAVHVFVPVNLRPPDAPIPPTLGNRFGVFLARLPTGPLMPAKQLATAQARANARRTLQPWITWAGLALLGLLPAAVERAVARWIGRRGSAVVTNVPGPAEPIALAGARVTGAIAWVPQWGPIGLGVSIFSHAGAIRVGVAADVACLDDPDALVAGIVTAVAALDAARIRAQGNTDTARPDTSPGPDATESP